VRSLLLFAVENRNSVGIADDKLQQKMLRDAAVARYAERAEQLKQQQAQVKHEEGRFAVRQQMKVNGNLMLLLSTECLHLFAFLRNCAVF